MSTQNYLPLWNEKKNYKKHSRIRFDTIQRQEKKLTQKINSKNREKKTPIARCIGTEEKKKRYERRKKTQKEFLNPNIYLYVYCIHYTYLILQGRQKYLHFIIIGSKDIKRKTKTKHT